MVNLVPLINFITYRHMKRIFPASFLLIFCFTNLHAQTNSTNLFDGTTLTGWKQLAGKASFEVFRGTIVGISVPNSPNSFLATEAQYSDFALEMEVLMDDTTGNSGVQFRSHFDPTGNGGKGKVYGYQYEVDPSARRWTAGIYDEGRRDWLYPMTLNPK